MSVLNKSSHPVLMKRINLESWTLRAEIEAKLATLIETNDETQIELTKTFYSDLKTLDSPEPLSTVKLGVVPDQKDEQESTSDKEDEVQAKAEIEFERVYPQADQRNNGFIFLSELNMDGILFFSKNTYRPGQNIVIEFMVTKPFTMIIEVIKSVPIDNKSKIISETRPNHRILGEFKFYFQGERTNLRNFLVSVEPTIPPPPKKIMKNIKDNQEDDSDDGIDLDDLGF